MYKAVTLARGIREPLLTCSSFNGVVVPEIECRSCQLVDELTFTSFSASCQSFQEDGRVIIPLFIRL